MKLSPEQIPQNIEQAKALTSVAVVITDSKPPFRISYVNQEWCRLCGYPMEEVIGRACSILQGPDTCRVTVATLGKAAREQLPIAVKIVNYAKVRARAAVPPAAA